ncbi:hypothetical protein [Streptacidiphilus anmyonensis]|uniref:hypothetical protein n=1 Tax=Streptacidiphilus anmyonensis TaxID=405782 RepID=UPI00128C021A|nr:hypothetical protein [Streptacidiphilus anmyonensis]
MISPARLALASAALAALLAATVSTPAGARPARRDFQQPQAVTGKLISKGADGTEQTLMCPPEESVLGGGYSVSAPTGHTLDATPADVLSDRPTDDATGWIVAVRKHLSATGGTAAPADLTLQIVCTEGESTPGG